MVRRIIAMLLPLLAAAGLAACSDDSPELAAPDDAASTERADPPIATFRVAEAADGFVVDAPDSLTGGPVTIRLDNRGAVTHSLQLLRATDGHTLDEVTAALGDPAAPLPDWLDPAGGVGTTAPGTVGEATVELTAGRYWYLCTETTDGGPGPHAGAGEVGEITAVGDGDTEVAAPDAAATVTASDYAFSAADLAAGDQIVELANTGEQLHHLLVAPIVAGRDFEAARDALVGGEENGAIAFDRVVVTAVVAPGSRVRTRLALEPGNYLLACMLPDRGTSEPLHVAKGMLAQVTIS